MNRDKDLEGGLVGTAGKNAGGMNREQRVSTPTAARKTGDRKEPAMRHLGRSGAPCDDPAAGRGAPGKGQKICTQQKHAQRCKSN